MMAEQERCPPSEGNKSGFPVEKDTKKCNYLSKYKKTAINIDSLAPVKCVVATNVNDRFPCTNEEDSRCYLKRAIWDSEDTVFETVDAATGLLRRNVVEITREISGKCDHCYTVDGRGFSKIDVELGYRIARFGIPNDWTSVRVKRWVQRLSKYSNQIDGDFYDRVFIGREW